MAMSDSKNSMLWRLRGEGFPPFSYVFGTMHAQDQRVFRLEQRIKGYIQDCEAFAAEMHLEQAAAAGVEHSFFLPPGQSLADLLSPREYIRLQRLLEKSFHTDIRRVDRLQPIMLANWISGQALSRDRLLALDHVLWEFAREEGKKLFGIETHDRQRELLESLSVEDQLPSLRRLIRSWSAARRQMLRLTDLYERGDLRQLHRSAKAQMGKWRRRMIYERNQDMAAEIVRLAADFPLFAAIGAGHLWGGKGVLRLLKQAGLRPEAVAWPSPES